MELKDVFLDRNEQREISIIRAEPGWAVLLAIDDEDGLPEAVEYETVLAWRIETWVRMVKNKNGHQEEQIDTLVDPVTLFDNRSFANASGYGLTYRDPAGRIFNPEDRDYKDEAEWIECRRQTIKQERNYRPLTPAEIDRLIVRKADTA